MDSCSYKHMYGCYSHSQTVTEILGCCQGLILKASGASPDESTAHEFSTKKN